MTAERLVAIPRARLDGALARLGTLMPALMGLALVAIVALLVAPQMLVGDTWLALVSGREIVRHGLPAHDQLAVLTHGRAWTDQQWLGQLLLYGVWRLGGLGGISALATGIALCAYGLPVLAAARGGANRYVLTLLPLFAVAAGPWGFQARPQTVGILGFAVVLYLLLDDREGSKRRTLLVLPILALWANVHGSVLLAALVVVVYALFLLARGAGSRALPFLAAPACVFASPYAPSLAHYYRLMLFDPPFKRLGIAGEWQSAGLSPFFAVFYALVAVVIVAVALRPKRYSSFELFLLGLTGAGGFLALRNIVWFGLATLFVLPRAGAERKEADRAAGVLAVLLAGVIVAVVAVSAARPASYYTARGLTQAAASAVGTSLDRVHGPVFADGEHADWLLWTVPRARGRIAFDARFELLSARQLQALAPVVLHGDPAPVLRSYPLAVLTPKHGRALAGSGWGRIVYADHTTVLVARSASGDRVH